MISCLLFTDRLEAAKHCNVKLNVTGWVGEGEAITEFEPDECLSNTVLYIPSLLCHETGARMHLSLTSCSLKWLQNDTIVRTDELALTKSNWKDPSMERCLLSHTKVKSKIESSVIKHAGALSPDDFLLSTGNIDNSTKMLVTVKFVFDFHPYIINDSSTVNCIFSSMMPCHKLTMQLNMTALTNILSVKNCLDGSTTSNLSAQLNDSKVSCILTNDAESTRSGFMVTMCLPPSNSPLMSSCFSLFLDNPPIVSLKGFDKSYRGVQMLSSMPHQNLGLSDWRKLSPCEMLFLVDCSGSMSGKKIHCTSEALMLAIKSLPRGCKFNIIAFGSKYRILFQNSMEASFVYIERALQFANQLQACLGGTELLTPLRWFLKKPISNNLHRHLMLITDGGVPNISDVLHTVGKYRHLTRCHTFALGPDISSELMAGIASETGGHYVIIDDETRLQTKVMEVVKLCLQPPVTDVAITWTPPSGYIAEPPFLTPSSIWVPEDTQTHFIGLTEAPHSHKNDSNVSITPPIVTGFLLNERVQATAELCHEKTTPITSRGAALLRNAAWFKMKSLNNELLVSGRKKRTERKDLEEPPSKRPRLNGSFQQRSNNDIMDEIVAISMSSGVSFFPYTHFKSSVPAGNKDERACQLLPWNSPVKRTKTSTRSSSHSLPSIIIRKRPRHHSTSSSSSVVPSFSQVAKRTASSFTSAFKTAVNIATFGYVNMDMSLEEGGERIEDQVYYQNKQDRIHWDNNNRLVLPKFYYKSHSEANSRSQTETSYSGSSNDSRQNRNIQNHSSGTDSDQSDNKERSYNDVVKPSEYSDESANDSSSEDKLQLSMETDETITSDETSSMLTNSANMFLLTSGSVDIRPDYGALIQLQLPSGGWPLIQAISLATSVPMTTIVNLPKSVHISSNCSEDGVKDEGDFWATVLALACLRRNFECYRSEWDLLNMKSEAWLCTKKELIPISIAETKAIADELVPKLKSWLK